MKFHIKARCSTTKARLTSMTLPHGETILPTFMPVATQGSIKGLTPQQTHSLGVTLQLNNTYHLNLRPGPKVLEAAGGAHKFQGWKGNLLTDSGGFQMVSLLDFTEITEEGVLFASPFDGKATMLTPEQSIAIQHSIGSDIMMQLDDVVSSLTTGPRVEEAMYRSIRWLDRCLAYHASAPARTHYDHEQTIFAIVQGGLDAKLRTICCEEMIKRKDDPAVGGYAIGGLSGGESKDQFWRIVSQCTSLLPQDRPIYSMGVGFAEDLLVVVALGVDMADCVYPTRVARGGTAITFDGKLNLRASEMSGDPRPIEKGCPCPSCSAGVSRSFLFTQKEAETTHHAITMHNITFQARLMGQARTAILEDRYPEYLKAFFPRYFAKTKGGIPSWCVDALKSVGVDLEVDRP